MAITGVLRVVRKVQYTTYFYRRTFFFVTIKTLIPWDEIVVARDHVISLDLLALSTEEIKHPDRKNVHGAEFEPTLS